MSDPANPGAPLYGTPSSPLLQAPVSPAPAPQPPVWGMPPAKPFPNLSPMNTAQSTPPVLQSFPPNTGPKQTKSQCPLQGKGGGTGGNKAPAPPAKPIKPCDIDDITIVVKEAGNTEKEGEQLTFSTLKAAGSQPAQRARELPAPPKAPSHIKANLSRYDVVVEVLGHPGVTPGVTAKMPVAESGSRKDMLTAKAGRKAVSSGSRATMIVSSKRTGGCGEAAHTQLRLTATGGGTPVAMPASFNQQIPCKSKATLGDAWEFLKSGLNPRSLGQAYEVYGGTCGVLAKGAPTTSLSALVTSFPTGTSGLKLSYTGFEMTIGWPDEDSKQLKKGYAKALANQLRIEEKKHGGGRKKAKEFRRNLKSARQEVNRLKNLMDASQDRSTNEIDLNLVLFDEEIDVKEASETYRKIRDALKAVKTIGQLVDTVSQTLSCISKYSPSLINPIASLAMTFGQIELFAGFKLASDDSFTDKVRYRALAMCIDVEVNCKIIELTGTLGIVFGKRILGTGASLEALVRPTIGVSIGAEYSSPLFPTENYAGWKDVKFKAQGDFGISGSVSGQVSLLYFHIACVSVDAGANGRIATDTKLGDVLQPTTKLAFTLNIDPAYGTASVYFFWFKQPKNYTYYLTEGSTSTPFTFEF